MNDSISKMNLNGKTIYIKVEWKENPNDLFHMKIFDGDDTTWSGKFSNAFVESWRDSVDESLEDYKKSVKNALVSESPDFVYEFRHTRDELTATFVWKKRYPYKDTFALRTHGSVPMHKDIQSQKKNYLIDVLLQENNDLKQKIVEYNMNNELLSNELEQSKSELERFISMKSSLEMSLYSKFVQMLNGKKKRIAVLEDNFERIGKSVNITSNQ